MGKKTIDKYKGDPFHNRDIAFLAEDPNYNRAFAARATKAEQDAFESDLRAYHAEGGLERVYDEVKDALDKGNFRGVPLREKDYDYPIVDPIKWTNITLKRYKAKDIPEHHGAEKYHMEMLISQDQLEMLKGEQITELVLNRFTSMFHSFIAKLLKETP